MHVFYLSFFLQENLVFIQDILIHSSAKKKEKLNYKKLSKAGTHLLNA